MAKLRTGIEIGTRQVKIAQCEGNRLCREIVEPLPDHVSLAGGRSLDTMALFLKEVKRYYHLKGRTCCLVLPDSDALTRRVKMPAMKAEHIAWNLPYEFHDFMRDRKKKWIFDYGVMGMDYGEDGKPKSMDLMAAAVPEQVMEEYRKMLHDAGWKLIVAAPAAFAYSNLIRELEKGEKGNAPKASNVLRPGTYCFVDLGYRFTRIRFFQGEGQEASHEIEVGCEQLVKRISQIRQVEPHMAGTYLKNNFEEVWALRECREIYEKAGEELRKTLGFYQYRFPDRTIKEIYLCGGGSRIRPFREIVAESLSLPVKDAGDLILKSVKWEQKGQGVLCPAAAGITFQ